MPAPIAAAHASLILPPYPGASPASLSLITSTFDWQILAGKRFVEAVGEERAASTMRAVRPGLVLRVIGRAQLNPRAAEAGGAAEAAEAAEFEASNGAASEGAAAGAGDGETMIETCGGVAWSRLGLDVVVLSLEVVGPSTPGRHFEGRYAPGRAVGQRGATIAASLLEVSSSGAEVLREGPPIAALQPAVLSSVGPSATTVASSMSSGDSVSAGDRLRSLGLPPPVLVQEAHRCLSCALLLTLLLLSRPSALLQPHRPTPSAHMSRSLLLTSSPSRHLRRR